MQQNIVDVAVIGGGINGCGCAADASLRGLSVVLVEMNDLASATSSASTKLIHGGLRYLELGELGLVRRALREREILLKLAPHLIHPQRFVIPDGPDSRAWPLLRAGLLLYDVLGFDSSLPRNARKNATQDPESFLPLKQDFRRSLQYFDLATDDARLVIANALQARQNGATLLTRTRLQDASVTDGCWQLTLQDSDGVVSSLRARSVINATGPWVNDVSALLQVTPEYQLTLVQGSHILLPKQFGGSQAYLLQAPDKRVVFTIPWQGMTLVGTTDTPFEGNPEVVHIREAEIRYLCEVFNRYFREAIGPADVIGSFSGVRPLIASHGDSPQNLSRDYAIQMTVKPAPVVQIYGGKLTTWRELAERAVDKLSAWFPTLPASKTAFTALPGATLDGMTFAEYQNMARVRYHWMDQPTLSRYLASYGTRTELLLSGKTCLQDLGVRFFEGLYQAEIDWLLREEWVKSTGDILWRRTRLGYYVDKQAAAAVEDYLGHKEHASRQR